MFFKVSLVGWKKYAVDKVKRHKWNEQVDQQRTLYQTLSKQFKEPEYPIEVTPTQETEIEKEVYIEMSCSSDEMDEQAKRVATRQNDTNSNLQLGSLQMDSVTSVRRIAKIRKRKSIIRFMDMNKLLRETMESQATNKKLDKKIRKEA
mmetsp:Transcript_20790/g.25431  ORF Transcript_20790/g.25431 Transcript_20790/m.25431 type:complete len:148 (-) Transcript_20790:648-1091(-)